MALKPDRTILDTNVNYFMFATGERGGVVCTVDGNGTGYVYEGASVDDSDRRVEYAADASGREPVGLLATDVVNIDQSRQILNPYKDEAQVGDKVTLVTKGRVVTNWVVVGQASGVQFPTPAYVGLNGRLYSDASYNTASGYPRVGRFMSQANADGYAEVEIEL